MRAEEKQGKQEKSIDNYARAALVVSIVAVLFTGIICTITYCSYVYNISPGEIHPLEPSGYAIVREIPPHPSDHIVIPLEWENIGGQEELVRHCNLILYEIGPDGKKTENKSRFLLAGEFPEMANRSFVQGYVIKESFIVDPHSILPKILVFHIENWWNESNETSYNFKFHNGENYQVCIVFDKNLEGPYEFQLFNMSMEDIDVDKLRNFTEDKRNYWNYCHLWEYLI